LINKYFTQTELEWQYGLIFGNILNVKIEVI